MTYRQNIPAGAGHFCRQRWRSGELGKTGPVFAGIHVSRLLGCTGGQPGVGAGPSLLNQLDQPRSSSAPFRAASMKIMRMPIKELWVDSASNGEY